MEVGKSVDRLVLVDHILLPKRLCIWLPGNHLRGEDVLLEEALLDELLQASSEGPIMDGLVPLCSRGRSSTSPTRVVRDWAGLASGV